MEKCTTTTIYKNADSDIDTHKERNAGFNTREGKRGLTSSSSKLCFLLITQKKKKNNNNNSSNTERERAIALEVEKESNEKKTFSVFWATQKKKICGFFCCFLIRIVWLEGEIDLEEE
ncbi:hypothetical protein Ahy_A06g029244 isoform A [Arachis hypogaea]|uniref:Uncharacterized protein n=1 Tax=Arachis hypogaea TaxID=3818 RepID=A0A445CSX4_ARAHY|nr:hypothetical protein Ahy_A06g029244 isoform A [Arachis hypogaea]